MAPRAEARWLWGAFAAIAALTAWRVGWLWASPAELYTDEAQYWLWGQEMALGAFSKPPLIGWIIRASVELTGLDTPFGARLPAALLHGLAAGLIALLGARLAGSARTGALAGLFYATMPAVGLGSFMISTDTPLLAAIAASLLIWQALAARRGAGGSRALALALGVAIGLGMLAKYAMLYALAGLALAALAVPAWRIARRDAGLAALVALVLFAPNLWWNVAHGFITLHHVASDANWSSGGLRWADAAGFFAAQFAVMGPVAFAAFVLVLARPWLLVPGLRGAGVVSGAILGIVLGQALASGAHANWAVGFVAAGAVVAAVGLAPHPRLAALALGLNAAVALALPVVMVAGFGWRAPSGDLLLKRFVGGQALATRAFEEAATAGAGTIVAADRNILAALTYAARAGGPAVRAMPEPAPVPHHYALRYPLAPSAHPVLEIAFAGAARPCRDGSAPAERARWRAGPGWAEGREIVARLAPATCWAAN